MAIYGKCDKCKNQTINYLCAFCLNEEVEELEAKNSLLEHRALLARELAIGYDGFNTIDGLKSLIDDMVRALNGELSFTNSKGEKISQDEVYK